GLRDPAKRETEDEWRDPEDASSAMQIQGILPEQRVLCSSGCATDSNTSFGFTFSLADQALSTSESPVSSPSAFISTSTIPLRASPKNTSAIAWCTTKATRTCELLSRAKSKSSG